VILITTAVVLAVGVWGAVVAPWPMRNPIRAGATADPSPTASAAPHFHGDLRTLLAPPPVGATAAPSLGNGAADGTMSIETIRAWPDPGPQFADELAQLGFVNGASTGFQGADQSSAVVELYQFASPYGAREELSRSVEALDRAYDAHPLPSIPGGRYATVELDEHRTILIARFAKNDIMCKITMAFTDVTVAQYRPWVQQQYDLLP
jgi:hypothetical protein